MNRVIRLFDEWLPVLASLAGLSGVVVPVYDGRFDDVDAPSLEQQLQDILNFVARQELSSSSAGPSRRAARRRLYPI